jgi:hypothetical protein
MGKRAAWVLSQLPIRFGQYKDWLFDSLWCCLTWIILTVRRVRHVVAYKHALEDVALQLNEPDGIPNLVKPSDLLEYFYGI